MNWTRLKNIVKWIWILAIFFFTIFYAINKRDSISQMLSLLSVEILLVAVLLVLFAKACLVANMRKAAMRFGIVLEWGDSYRIYNFTQLGKYIPGSIWQFVGRVTILRERSVPITVIRDSLLAEHLWVISSAVLLAGILILTSRPDFFIFWLADAGFEIRWSWFLAALALLLITVISALFMYKRLSRWLLRLMPPSSAVPALLLTWFFLGASLWVTILPFVESMPPLSYVVGIYCFAYLAGFLVPFAPAGLGIREAILTFALMAFVRVDVAILLAAVNRILYFGVEVLLALLGLRAKNLFIPGPKVKDTVA